MDNTKKKKIVLTGGGTAGHVSPNIALLPYLQEAGYEITYVGSKKGIGKNPGDSLPDKSEFVELLFRPASLGSEK